MKMFYQTDESGVFRFPIEADSLPFSCIDVAPPKTETGSVAVWKSDVERVEAQYGLSDTGRWSIEVDNRNKSLYLTKDGNLYDLGEPVEEDTYNGVGAIPHWLTPQERPDGFHEWKDGDWVEDEAAKYTAQSDKERAWRNQEIERQVWLRERHRDEIDARLETTLSNEQFSELLAYIQALRDWTKSPAFPNPDQRPVKLDWF